MSHPLNPSPRPSTPSLDERADCPACGGSGVLRINHQRFRTCLDCLGQGVLPQFDTSPELSRLLNAQSQPAPIKPGERPEVELSAGAFRVASR